MDQPSFDVAGLLYPDAQLLDQQEYGGVHNVLLATTDELGKVWGWYSRRLGTGVSQSGVGERTFEAGKLRSAVRRTSRVVSRDAPFADTEQPQIFTVQQGNRAVTVVLSRGAQTGETAIVLLVFG